MFIFAPTDTHQVLQNNVKIKIAPTCFGVIKPSSGRSGFVSAEVMNYYLIND
jgi:hypothetical protein